MLIYRPHRELLSEAMREAKTFDSLDKLKQYVVDWWNRLGKDMLSTDDIVLGKETFDDERVGWKNCHYLCAKRLGKDNYAHPQCIGTVGEV